MNTFIKYLAYVKNFLGVENVLTDMAAACIKGNLAEYFSLQLKMEF